MSAGGLFSVKRVRLIVAIVYASSLCALAAWLPGSVFVVPLIMIVLGLPLIFRLVPRNYLYGMRSARTLWTTEEIWYQQNVITGVVMVGIGLVWLGVLAVRLLA